MLEHLKPYLQEQADDPQGGAGGGGEPVSRKQYVEAQLEKRYVSREAREVLARYHNDANVALENSLRESDEIIRRLMKRQAELEYDLQAAQSEVKSSAERIKQVEQERDQLSAILAERTAKEREAAISAKLKERFGDDTIVRRHQAYLHYDGYTIELEGDRLMLRKGDKRYNFDTIVNDAWYERYDDARPSSDTPLPQGTTQDRGGSRFDPKAASDAYRDAVQQRRQRIHIPGVTNG